MTDGRRLLCLVFTISIISLLLLTNISLIKGEDITYKERLYINEEQVIYIIDLEIDYVKVIRPDNLIMLMNVERITTNISKVAFNVDIVGEWRVEIDGYNIVFEVDKKMVELVVEVRRHMLSVVNAKVEIYKNGELIKVGGTDNNGRWRVYLEEDVYTVVSSDVAKTVDLSETNYVVLEIGGYITLPHTQIEIPYALLGACLFILIFLIIIYKVLTKKGGGYG